MCKQVSGLAWKLHGKLSLCSAAGSPVTVDAACHPDSETAIRTSQARNATITHHKQARSESIFNDGRPSSKLLRAARCAAA